MVGIPIVFVTSYVLYQRCMNLADSQSSHTLCADQATVFLGKEQTALVPPPEEGQVTHDG